MVDIQRQRAERGERGGAVRFDVRSMKRDRTDRVMLKSSV